jgi:acetoin utilization protein AcuB
MKVSEIMKAPVITVTPALPIEEAFEILRKKGIRHLPVVDDQDRLIGIISDKDLRQALVPAERIGEEKRYFYFKNLVFVKDVMTQEPLFVRPDTDVERAAYSMFTKKIGALVVLEERKIMGILTRSDLLLLLIGILGMLKEGTTFLLEEDEGHKALTTAFGAVSGLGGKVLSVAVKGLEGAKRPSYKFRVEIDRGKQPELFERLQKAGLKLGELEP